MARGRNKRLNGVREEILKIIALKRLTTRRITLALKEKFDITQPTVKTYLEELKSENRIDCMTAGESDNYKILLWTRI